MKISTRLSVAFGVMLLLILTVSIVAFWNARTLEHQVTEVVNDRIPKITWANNILDQVNIGTRTIRDMMLLDDLEERRQLSESISDVVHIIKANLDSIDINSYSEEARSYVKLIDDARLNYVAIRQQMVNLALEGRDEEAMLLLHGDLSNSQREYFDALDRTIDYQTREAVSLANEAQSVAFTTEITSAILSGIGIIISVILILVVFRTIIKPLNLAVEASQNIADGNLNVEFDTNRKDEIGTLNTSMDLMATNIKELIHKTNELVTATTNGKLDTRMKIENLKGEYSKLAEGLNSLLDAVIAPLNVTAEYIDRISKGDMPPQITDEYKGDFNEIKNNINQCIDSINSLISDASMLAKAAEAGKLDTRANANNHNGDFRAIIQGVNNTLDNVIGPLNVAAEYIDRISKGDIPPVITDEYKGDFNEIKNNLNHLIEATNEITEVAKKLSVGNTNVALTKRSAQDEMIDSLIKVIENNKHDAENIQRMAAGDLGFEVKIMSTDDDMAISTQKLQKTLVTLIDDMAILSKAAVDGNLQTRADVNKHLGDFKKIVQGVNDTLDSVLVPINEAVEVLKKMAEGNFSVKVIGDYKGDHATIKNALNTTIEQMPLKETIKVMQAMSDGDLTKKIAGDYKGEALELKNAINSTLSSMNEILGQVASTVDEVAQGALQVSDASGALSQGATEQAASLEEITSSMSELGSQTKNNATNANQANLLTNEAKNAAEKGNIEMSELNKAMQEISLSSANISKIIKVIDEIAFQTNLLALNAAVEAARAGRHGKGFAVVAEEVRNLAARSATAAKETSELIEGSIKTVENGSSLAHKTAEALAEIRNGSIKAADIVGEIATASNEQAQGISQINVGLNQIDKVTQTNTASAEESASAAEELSGQAAQLRSMISRFKLTKQSYGTYNEYDESYTHAPMPNFSHQKHSRRLPEAKSYTQNLTKEEFSPNDIINLDGYDFGKY